MKMTLPYKFGKQIDKYLILLIQEQEIAPMCDDVD